MNESKETIMLMRIEDLEKRGYQVIIKSDSHVEVQSVDKIVDYWPTTGKWRERGSPFTNSGHLPLVQHLGDTAAPVAVKSEKEVIAELQGEISRLKAHISHIEHTYGVRPEECWNQ